MKRKLSINSDISLLFTPKNGAKLNPVRLDGTIASFRWQILQSFTSRSRVHPVLVSPAIVLFELEYYSIISHNKEWKSPENIRPPSRNVRLVLRREMEDATHGKRKIKEST